MVFWAIAAGDYLDGFLARVTGQYSRMGALLDPLVDRLTILSGAVVCWSFELLPRWALALLALRELAMLVPRPVRPAPRGRHRGQLAGADLGLPDHGRDLPRAARAGWVATALLIWGSAMAILATVLYARDRHARGPRAARCKLSAQIRAEPSTYS